MPSLMSLGRMVDLALGTPEVRAVNFNLLHSLLRAMVSHLGLDDIKAEASDEGPAAAAEEAPPRGDCHPTATTGPDQSGLGEKKKETEEEGSEGGGKVGKKRRTKAEAGVGERRKSVGSANAPRFEELERKVEELEQQWKQLNSFPSNGELLDYMRTLNEAGDGKRTRPVTDMWLSLQLSKKVEANTEGVSKSLSLIEDLFHEIEALGSSFDQQLQESEEFEESQKKPDSWLPIGNVDATQSDDVSNQLQDFETKEMVGTESSAKRRRYKMQARLPSSDNLHQEPSAELQELVERIGKLTEEQEALKTRLDQLEMNIKEKADRAELILLGEELTEKMTNMLVDVEQLRRSNYQNIDVMNQLEGTVNQLQDSVNHFQETVEDLTEATQRLSDESINHQNHLETLFCSCKELNEKKADKDFVENEVSVMANKEHLEEKVSCQNFDSTCDEINNTINDLVNKLLGHEDDWKQTMTRINSAVEGKLDRLEFGPFRDELEKQLRLIAKKMAAAQAADGGGGKGELTDDDAAGFRRQLLQTFHCISCNKPLDVKSSQRPVPCLPSIPGLPETHSLRPYTVFELNQIRQLAHSHANNQQPASQVQDLLDLCNKPRFCGGSHTLTYPHRRITRLSLASHLNPPPAPPSQIPLPSDNPPPPPRPPQLGSSKGSPSSKLHASVHKSSSSVKQQRPQHHQQQQGHVSRCESPLEPLNVTANQSVEGSSIIGQQQPLSRTRSKKERSKSNIIVTSAKEEEQARDLLAMERSILSSSVTCLENDGAEERLETTSSSPLPPIVPSTEGAVVQGSMLEGSTSPQIAKKAVE